MKLLFAILLFMVVCIPVSAQKVLFKSKIYEIESDKVKQNGYEVVAKSRDEISSSYISSYKLRTSNELDFKFSINGLDNERDHGQDHHLVINPQNGKFVSPIYTFGQPDPKEASGKDGNLSENTDLILRLDMRNVLNDFKTKGYYETFDGNKIDKKDFKGVFIAGGTSPLIWDFETLGTKPQFKLLDPDDKGIYEIKIHLNKEQLPGERKEKWINWKLSKDISSYPSYRSPDILVDALYNKALEEMLLNIRPDGAFMAGAKWTGVWTRDISYSIFLSLAIVNPDASKTSLMAKVKNDRIIQDTGTGGAWPVSSDRLVWAIAAWEIYLSTGDMNWLQSSYKIIKNSAEDDLNIIYDKSTGLFRGESSFLDWREQTYPRWMDPKDIYSSENLGTNAVHYQTFKILAEMAKIIGESPESYLNIAAKVKEGMNKYLWVKNKNYYGQYLYGRNYFSLSPKSEALGEALSVLFGIAGNENEKYVIEKTPVTQFGITCIYPQIPNIPPYHNNAVWPFVESYWAWASAKAGNSQSVENAFASVYRAASLFTTNKENFVASTGDYLGTEINSDRQLWSVAGNLALVYRVIFGISLEPDSISFHPFIPKEYNGERTLNNFKLRNAVFAITIKGFGDKMKILKLDGKEIMADKIPASLKGNHSIIIEMNNHMDSNSSINLVDNNFSPETPVIKIEGNRLAWQPIHGASHYVVYKNGRVLADLKYTQFAASDEKGYSAYQVLAVDKKGNQSFLSEPVCIIAEKNKSIIQAEVQNKVVENDIKDYTGTGYVLLDKNKFPNQEVIFEINIPDDGEYSIDFRYANGNGPINTDNKCAIRTLKIDEKTAGAIILPQRGIDNWTDWGYTNSILTKLTKGRHTFKLTFEPSDNNMNVEVNTALVDYLRLIKVN